MKVQAQYQEEGVPQREEEEEGAAAAFGKKTMKRRREWSMGNQIHPCDLGNQTDKLFRIVKNRVKNGKNESWRAHI